MSNKTKIICTIGPASNSVDILVSLINSGMDAARLNFSHGNYDSHKEIITNIRTASGKCGIRIPILIDLQGPKIRVGNLENGFIELIKDNSIRISRNQVTGNKDVISSTYKNLTDDLKTGDIILMDDGLLKLQVIDVTGDEAVCKIIKGGILKEKKGINLPHTNLKLPSLSDKDFSDIEFGINNNIDLLALSFVREQEDVIKLKEHLKNKNYDIPIIAKIERPEAINRIDEIIDVSDAVMVARGDLGIEMSPEDVPVLQKMIIKKCNKNLKPVITATQMLESMVSNVIPTRAEASDVANAIFDGTDCVMLSAETSIGSDPVNVVQTMERIIAKTDSVKKPKFLEITDNHNQLESLCNSATELASRIDAKVIVTVTKTGKSPLYLSSHRIQAKIISASNDERINMFNNLVWGVQPYFLRNYNDIKNNFDEIITYLKTKNLANKSDRIIIIYNKNSDEIESADTISVLEI